MAIENLNRTSDNLNLAAILTRRLRYGDVYDKTTTINVVNI